MATVKEQKRLYDNKEHLRELIKELVTLHKDDGYENFEEISLFIREKNKKLDTFQYKLPYKDVKKCFQRHLWKRKFLQNFLSKKDIHQKLS